MVNYGASIQLTDRMTGTINSILNKLNTMNMTCSSVQDTIENSFRIPGNVASGYDAISDKISETENDINKNRTAQNNFNQSVSNGVSKASLLQSTIAKAASAFGLYKIGSELMQTGKQAVEYASDLTEVQNVVDVTFGSSASAINDWSTQTLEAYGLNQLSAKQYSGTMGAMLKSSGIAQDAVGDMSMTITELAGDMASFYNLSGDEAFQKIRSGISGETEPLKQLGVNMSVANLEAYAMSQGINTAYQEMTQAEQTMLRYNYLLSVTSDAQGDFARTSDSYANQTKLLSENWKAFTGDIASAAIPQLASLAQRLNSMFQSDGFQIFAAKMKNGISIILTFVEKLLSGISKVGTFFVNNWSVIKPLILGITFALALYTAALIAHNTVLGVTAAVKGICAIAEGIHAASMAISTGATFAATAAQYGFNTALFACPITWIILAVIALIAIIFAVITAILKAQNRTTSTLGIIMGAVYTVGAFLYNLFGAILNWVLGSISFLINKFINFANFFANVFKDPIGSVIQLFGNMADNVLSVIQTIASAIDFVFGSKLADSVSGWRGSLSAKIEDATAKYGNGKYSEVVNQVNLSAETFGMERKEYGTAFKNGTNKGDEWSQKIDEFSNSFAPEALSSMNDIGTNVENTATAADEIADDVGTNSTEQLKWLRMIAEREAVNKFTTASISLTVNSDAVVNNTTDLDGFVTTLTDAVADELVSTANGLHV